MIADLRSLAKEVRPVGATLKDVLVSFRDTGGIERAMDYIFYQVAAINGFDAVGHYLRAGLIVNNCATYAQAQVPGCSAKFPVPSTDSSSVTAKTANAIDATGDDPVLRATAIALARALGQEVEKAKQEVATEKQAAKQPKAKAKTKRAKRSKPREDTTAPLESVPTVDARAGGAARGHRRARAMRLPPESRADGHPRADRERDRDPAAGPVRRAAGLPVRGRRMRSRGGGIAGNPVLIGAATVLVILVAVFLSYNANKGLPFVPTYQVDAEVPSAAQLVVGNDVKIGGSRVGAVTEITPKTLRRRDRDRGPRADAGQGRGPAAQGLHAARALALGARPEVRRGHPRALAGHVRQTATRSRWRRPRRRSSSTSS